MEGKLRKFLITEGMNEDQLLFLTDAPKKRIKKWCRNYVKEQINAENTFVDTLKEEGYYVKILFDSSLETDEGQVEAIGYDKTYDLNEFYEKGDF